MTFRATFTLSGGINNYSFSINTNIITQLECANYLNAKTAAYFRKAVRKLCKDFIASKVVKKILMKLLYL